MIEVKTTGTPTRPVPESPPRSRSGLSRPQPDVIRVTSQIVVVGAGGHGRELADIVQAISAISPETELLGMADDGEPDLGLIARSGLRFLGPTASLLDRNVEFALGVGEPKSRKRLDGITHGRAHAPLIHPTAQLGSQCRLTDGVVLAPRVVLTTNITIGRHTHVNVGSTISHDVRIGDYVTICPGVTLTGGVEIGDRVFVGAGTTVLPGVAIGDHAVIGAGSLVVSDVEPGRTVKGSPAR
ncbi:MAG: acetyltransferase [Acidimicrobiales bacterium]